jgi:hypothetical protein
MHTPRMAAHRHAVLAKTLLKRVQGLPDLLGFQGRDGVKDCRWQPRGAPAHPRLTKIANAASAAPRRIVMRQIVEGGGCTRPA